MTIRLSGLLQNFPDTTKRYSTYAQAQASVRGCTVGADFK
jgi:hypothetical protein